MSTIKGYRSAIAPLLKTHGIDITNNQYLTMFIKSLDLQRPTSTSRTPKWDLTIVLRSLTKPPYEIPGEEPRLIHLLHKTAFLLAFASAKRIGEIHALTRQINQIDNWKIAIISFDPTFLAKTQDPAKPETGLGVLRIPALAPHMAHREDRLLCPVRCLRAYLKRTGWHKSSSSPLFLTTSENPRPAAKATISSWIKQVITTAHASADPEDARLVQAKVHEVRALSTSALFLQTHSLQAVMEAACWRNHNTFSQFYLRDIAMHSEGMISLGHIVAGQRILGPPSPDD